MNVVTRVKIEREKRRLCSARYSMDINILQTNKVIHNDKEDMKDMILNMEQERSTVEVDMTPTAHPTASPSKYPTTDEPTMTPSASPSQSPTYFDGYFIADYKYSFRNSSHGFWVICHGQWLDITQ
eukprot:861942_1